jgi:hypothetical protein
MNPRDLPVLSSIIEAGTQDRFFDGLLLLGPLVVTVVAVLGRSRLTESVAAAYLVVFIGYVLYSTVE